MKKSNYHDKKNNALLILEIYQKFKNSSDDLFTVQDLINLLSISNRTSIVEALGYLLQRQVITTANGENFRFNKDMDNPSYEDLKRIGEVNSNRPEL